MSVYSPAPTTMAVMWYAREFLRLWLNESSSGFAPTVTVRDGDEFHTVKYGPRWDGRSVEFTVSQLSMSGWPTDRIRDEFLKPKLFELLPHNERKSRLRNRLLASMRVPPVEGFIQL